MTPRFLIFTSFGAGFAVATALGLMVVLPADRDALRVKVDSDVHLPMLVALQTIEETARTGDCAETARQLHALRDHFAAYREGGAPPELWVSEITASTQPAE